MKNKLIIMARFVEVKWITLQKWIIIEQDYTVMQVNN